MSPGFSHLTFIAAYVLFTPSNSGQRSPPTYYRGCWHVVSRGFRMVPSFLSSHTIELYDPKAFFTHAASLCQGFPHCTIFPTAASRRSLDRVSVPVWPFTLSGRLPIVALVGRYPHQLANGTRTPPIADSLLSSKSDAASRHYPVLAPLSRCYPSLQGRLSTRYSPVRR